MPRGQNISVINSLSRGYLTEATPLTFPENACTDTINCVFDRTGFASRRPGFDFEDRYGTTNITFTGCVVNSYLWLNVSGEGDVSFVVVQVGETLYYYKVLSEQSLSASKHSHTTSLSSFYSPGTTSVATLDCQFSSGNGRMFVTNGHLESFYVSYDLASDSFTETELTLQYRDLIGDTADSLAVDNRPAVSVSGLDAHHHYNLLNQGWTSTTLASWDTARTDMPSNADVSWYFKDTSDNFDFTIVDQRAVGNSPAPKGHFIYSIYNTNRSSNQSGATDSTISQERVSNSAFFAGRIFFSGIKVTGENSKIFFTQILSSDAQYGLCYEANDPTSETLFDLLPTDGGVIDIQDAGTIYKMFPALNALIIFASNGVWTLTGSQGIGFTANDYTLSKVSSVRSISSKSFIDVEGIPYWWNLDGIYTVTLDPQTNAIKVISTTDTTIKTFYDTIPGESKQYAKGTYDSFTKKLHWIYKSAPSISFEDKYVFDRMLTFSLITNAFIPWSIDTSRVQIHAVVDIIGTSGAFGAVNVVDSAVNVTDSGTQVIDFENTSDSIDSVIKYFCSFISGGTSTSTFAECANTNNVDWFSYDSIGQTYASYFIVGWKIKGNGLMKFQQNYVDVFSDGTVNGSYVITGLWDFASDASTNRWTIPQTMTTVGGDYTSAKHRVKLRGTGIACQFKISNNGNDPFKIFGWSVFESGNKWV